jgi:hypothetical protein
MSRFYVVTGGGRGVGRALVERLLGDSNVVAAIEVDSGALDWTNDHPSDRRVIAVVQRRRPRLYRHRALPNLPWSAGSPTRSSRSNERCAGCIPLEEWGVPTRSRPPSPTCYRTTPAS